MLNIKKNIFSTHMPIIAPDDAAREEEHWG
jgi:hypothetical protein